VDTQGIKKGQPVWIAVVFFFVGFCPGMWIPGLPTVLQDNGYGSWTPVIYIGIPIGSIISPLLLGALSDGKIAAQKLCGYVMFLGGISMTLAFTSLWAGVRIEIFVALMLANSLLSAPLWALVTQCALSYLDGREEKFPFYRVFGTIGWMIAGLVGGLLLQADSSPLSGFVGGLIRFPVALACFLMPACEPRAKSEFSFLQMLGSGSRDLWKDRNTRVLFISAGLIAIPLASFFMFLPLQMKELGVDKPTAWMSLSQWFEIPAMLTLAWASRKFRIKWLITFGLGMSALRQGLFALSVDSGQFSWILLGLLTHGITFSYFLTVAQMYMERRVAPELRGRAQGMLSLMFGGFGGLIGVIVVSVIFHSQVDVSDGQGWAEYWWVMTALSAIPTAYFTLRYRKVE